MSLVPNPTYSAPGVPLYVSASALTFPVGGNSSNLTWSATTGNAFPAGSYSALIPSTGNLTPLYGLTSNSVVVATVQSGSSNDVQNCWLMVSKPAPTTINGCIQVVVAAQPTSGATFTITWAILQP